jgi:hypothetical protein
MKETKFIKVGPAIAALMLVLTGGIGNMPIAQCAESEQFDLVGCTDLIFTGLETSVLYEIQNPDGNTITIEQSNSDGELYFHNVMIDRSGEWKLINANANVVTTVLNLVLSTTSTSLLEDTNTNEFAPSPVDHIPRGSLGGNNVVQKVGTLDIVKGHCVAEGEDAHVQAKVESGGSITFETRWDFEEVGNTHKETWEFYHRTTLDGTSKYDDEKFVDAPGSPDGAGGELRTTYSNLKLGTHSGSYYIQCKWSAVSWTWGTSKGSANADDSGKITVLASNLGVASQAIQFDILSNTEQIKVTTTRISEVSGVLDVLVLG